MWWLAQGEHEVDADDAWMTPGERAMLAGMRYSKRRVEFLTRRWTAKRAVAHVLGRGLTTAALAGVEIRHHVTGAPWVAVDGQPAPIDISISDRAGWAVCLVGPPGAGSALGVDLELVEPRSEGFVSDFFTAAEAAAVRRLAAGEARDEAANLIWSAKEAALKVMKVGLRADTRDVAVAFQPQPRADGWAALEVTHRDGAAFPGWWRRDGVFLLTLASREAFAPPELLQGGGALSGAVPVHSWLARPLVQAAAPRAG